MRKENTFKVPNQLISDGNLSFTARRMGVVLYSRINRFGTCRKSLHTLAELACCAVATAHKAISELEGAGYITRSRHYRFDPDLQRPVYDCNTYHCPLVTKSFTLVPRRVFQHDLSASSFILCMYLFQQAGNNRRAFPSISLMGDALAMGRSTVCRCLRLLRAGALWLVQTCRKLSRDLSCNSYYVLHDSACAPVEAEAHAGDDTPFGRVRQTVGRILAAPLRLLHSIRTAAGKARLSLANG